jgi:hypothetical protein
MLLIQHKRLAVIVGFAKNRFVMAHAVPAVKMMPVNAELFESVGYVIGVRQLVIKFRRPPTLCFNNVPGFHFEGLMKAPRKDAYYNTFIKDRFIAKEIVLPPTV